MNIDVLNDMCLTLSKTIKEGDFSNIDKEKYLLLSKHLSILIADAENQWKHLKNISYLSEGIFDSKVAETFSSASDSMIEEIKLLRKACYLAQIIMNK